MDKVWEFIAMIGMSTIFITPLTLIVGMIHAIKKPDKEATPYIIIAVISAYLIIIPFMYFKSVS